MSETAGSTRRVMTRLAERHYAHLSPVTVADTVRANFGEAGIVEKGTVRRSKGGPPSQDAQAALAL